MTKVTFSKLINIVGGNVAAQILNGGVSHQTGDLTLYLGETPEMKEISQNIRSKDLVLGEFGLTPNPNCYSWIFRGNKLILKQCIDSSRDESLFDYFHVEIVVGKVKIVPLHVHEGTKWVKITGVISGEMVIV
jgi:hypothetical protein